MLPTFVIGLREGLEASLIVGIVATFLRRNGRPKDMWSLWIGVGAGVALCTIGAIALRIAERDLPQKQQEGLETVVGLVAVAFVSWMIIWTRGHVHELKGELEANAAAALAAGSAGALILMAFLAVLREGFETSVFLLALMQSSNDTASTLSGAVLGIALAIVIGYGIYRGGVRLNMARFFRARRNRCRTAISPSNHPNRHWRSEHRASHNDRGGYRRPCLRSRGVQLVEQVRRGSRHQDRRGHAHRRRLRPGSHRDRGG